MGEPGSRPTEQAASSKGSPISARARWPVTDGYARHARRCASTGHGRSMRGKGRSQTNRRGPGDLADRMWQSDESAIVLPHRAAIPRIPAIHGRAASDQRTDAAADRVRTPQLSTRQSRQTRHNSQDRADPAPCRHLRGTCPTSPGPSRVRGQSTTRSCPRFA